jgi:hypothetical protein
VHRFQPTPTGDIDDGGGKAKLGVFPAIATSNCEAGAVLTWRSLVRAVLLGFAVAAIVFLNRGDSKWADLSIFILCLGGVILSLTERK